MSQDNKLKSAAMPFLKSSANRYGLGLSNEILFSIMRQGTTKLLNEVLYIPIDQGAKKLKEVKVWGPENFLIQAVWNPILLSKLDHQEIHH